MVEIIHAANELTWPGAFAIVGIAAVAGLVLVTIWRD